MTAGMILNAYISATGHHAASWRHPLAAAEQNLDVDYYASLARTSERGLFHSLFLADGAGGGRRDAGFGGTLEPLTLLSALAMVTNHVGLIATASTSFLDPFTMARLFASLDHISHGRAAWNIVTTADAQAGAQYGVAPLNHTERYQRADEYLDVVTKLWDSFEADAILNDKATGKRLDGSKLHDIDHHGERFNVKGPLSIPETPQGRPVLVQAGASDEGMDFAARWADVVYAVQQTLEDSKAFRNNVRERARLAGRDPDSVKIIPGLSPAIGSTEAEAQRLQDELDDIVVPRTGPVARQEYNRVDLSGYALDEPLPFDRMPDPSQIEGQRGRFELVLRIARRENLTVRQILRRLMQARGHHTMAGTPEQVADDMEAWFRAGACDGFNLLPSVFPSQFDVFVDEVVPILQRRGLYHTAYEGTTMRENCGLKRPVSRYVVAGQNGAHAGSEAVLATGD